MSVRDNFAFFASGGRISHLREMYRLVRPQEPPEGSQKIRTGCPDGDGGYVMIRDFDGISAAISLGISDEISWDMEIAGQGIPVYQFDHTVDAPAAVASQPLLRFHKIGIAGEGTPLPGMKSIAAILADEMAMHQGDLILKMDIDGWEWEVFESMPQSTLCRFRQICMEIHQPIGRPADALRRKRHLAVLRKLHAFFAPVHLHANNAGKVRCIGGIHVPKLLEITWLRRDGRLFSESREVFPGKFDAPNIAGSPEIPIGSYFQKAGD